MVFNVEFCFGPHKYALKLILCIKVAFDYVFDFFFSKDLKLINGPMLTLKMLKGLH